MYPVDGGSSAKNLKMAPALQAFYPDAPRGSQARSFDRPMPRILPFYAAQGAVYTRKSSEEGLEQDFNSLHAQREACEAFIKSQAGEGWKLVPTAYDDGGISGGTMERPGLKALMSDIGMGMIDTIVVYKVDRLTRSLSDFAKMVEIFDRHGISFVAVTQQFNTTTSMGRLTLNILLSFAQFEREVTGERIRDKIAASKRKGMWMGGLPPLGYDVRDRKLAVNETEAETVRRIFILYVEAGSIQELKREADRRGIISKRRTTADGRSGGAKPISRGNLYQMLTNPLYIGQVRHKGVCHTGQHNGIIDHKLWEETQARLDENRQGTKLRRRSRNVAPLLDKLFDEAGERLVPTHAQKQGRRYRYYTSHFLIGRDPAETRKGWRLPAVSLERAVRTAVDRLLDDHALLATAWRDSELPFETFQQTTMTLKRLSSVDAFSVVERIEISPTDLAITISLASLMTGGPTMTYWVPVTLRRRGMEMRMVLDGERRIVDPALTSTVAKGHAWFAQLASSEVAGLAEIANRDGVSKGWISRTLPLAFLSPRIVQAIAEGRQPTELTARTLASIGDLPPAWAEQEARLGFPSR